MTRIYARFYYPEFIRDYPTVYANDHAFACWMRLLVVAEQMWPMVPELPRSAKSSSLRVLVDAGLIATDGTSFAIKGHAQERGMRSGLARHAADVRWQSGRNADAHADAMPSTSTSIGRAEIPPPPTSGGRRSDRTNQRATGASPRQNGHSPRDTGTSPRQEREKQKRGPTALGAIIREAADHGG